jgi:hypothetical protein
MSIKRWPLIVGSLVLAACADPAKLVDAGSHQAQQPTADTTPPVRYTVPPGVASLIALHTLPNAARTLHRAGEAAQAQGLTHYADPDGTLRFQIRPSAARASAVFEGVAKVVFECTTDETLARHPLELGGGSGALHGRNRPRLRRVPLRSDPAGRDDEYPHRIPSARHEAVLTRQTADSHHSMWPATPARL